MLKEIYIDNSYWYDDVQGYIPKQCACDLKIKKIQRDLNKNIADDSKRDEKISANTEAISANTESEETMVEEISANTEAILDLTETVFELSANTNDLREDLDNEIDHRIKAVNYCISLIASISGVSSATSAISEIEEVIDSIHMEKTDEYEYTLFVDEEAKGTINIPKDQFLKEVYYDTDTKDLVFIFVTTEGEKTVKVNVSDLVDEYTAGSGLTVSDNKFSIKVGKDEKHLIANDNGLTTVDVESASHATEQYISLQDSIASANTKIDNEILRATTVETNILKSISGNTKLIDELSDALAQEIENRENEDNTLDAKISANTTNITTISGDVKTCQSGITKVENSVTLINTVLTSLSNALNELQPKVTQNTEDIAALKDKDIEIVALIQQNKKDVDDAISGINDSISALNTKHDTDIASINTKITNINSNINSINGEITSLKTTDIELNGKISALDNKVELYKEQTNLQISSVSGSLETKIGTVALSIATEATTRESQDRILQGEIDGLTNSVTNITTNVTTLNTDVTKLKNDVTGLTTDIATINGNISTIDNSITTINSNIDKIQKAQDKTATVIENIKTDIDELYDTKADKTDITDVTTLINNVDKKVGTVDKKVDKLSESLDDYAKKEDIPNVDLCLKMVSTGGIIDANSENAIALANFAKKDYVNEAVINTTVETCNHVMELVEAKGYDTIVDVNTKLTSKLDVDAQILTDLQTAIGQINAEIITMKADIQYLKEKIK